MHFLDYSKYINDIIEINQNEMSLFSIQKKIGVRIYKYFALTSISMIITIIMFITNSYLSMKNISSPLLSFLSFCLLFISLFLFKKYKKIKVIDDIKVNEYKAKVLRKYYSSVKLKVNEVKFISNVLLDMSKEVHFKNLRLSSAFAILLLPFWNFIVENFLLSTNLFSINIMVALKVALLIVIIFILIIIFLYIERVILFYLNFKSRNLKSIAIISNLVSLDISK